MHGVDPWQKERKILNINSTPLSIYIFWFSSTFRKVSLYPFWRQCELLIDRCKVKNTAPTYPIHISLSFGIALYRYVLWARFHSISPQPTPLPTFCIFKGRVWWDLHAAERTLVENNIISKTPYRIQVVARCKGRTWGYTCNRKTICWLCRYLYKRTH